MLWWMQGDGGPGCTLMIEAGCSCMFLQSLSTSARLHNVTSIFSSYHLFCSVTAIRFLPLSTDRFISLYQF